MQLAEDFELCVQTGGLACNYFDRYAASVTPPPKLARPPPKGPHTGGGILLAAMYPSKPRDSLSCGFGPPSHAPSFDMRGAVLLLFRHAQLGRDPSRTYGEKRHVQMIASTCLLLAAKFFDRRLPPLSELSKVHHGKVSPAEFAILELEILERLRWKLHTPLPHAFTEHLVTLCWNAPFTPAIEERTAFFMDLSVYGAPASPPRHKVVPRPPPKTALPAVSLSARPSLPPPHSRSRPSLPPLLSKHMLPSLSPRRSPVPPP